jgi:hypothetical protein
MRRLLVALCAMSLGATVFAQTGTDSSAVMDSATGFGFRIGGFFPADGSLRDSSATWVDFAIEYDLEQSLFGPGVTFIGLDWISPSFFGGEHEAALHIDQRFYLGPRRYSAGGSAYFFLGVGAVGIDANGDSSSGWLARGGVGTELRGNTFIELAALVSPKFHGVNPSGISASVGYRFK